MSETIPATIAMSVRNAICSSTAATGRSDTDEIGLSADGTPSTGPGDSQVAATVETMLIPSNHPAHRQRGLSRCPVGYSSTRYPSEMNPPRRNVSDNSPSHPDPSAIAACPKMSSGPTVAPMPRNNHPTRLSGCARTIR